MRFALCKEWQRAKVTKPCRSVSRHRQSRWLSKERGCGRGKRDRCQNKGDSQSPDLGAKERLKEWPLAEFARGKQKWGRTVRMELDYTRQSSMVSFTKSRAILSVFKLMIGKDLAMRYRLDVGQRGGKRPVCPPCPPLSKRKNPPFARVENRKG